MERDTPGAKKTQSNKYNSQITLGGKEGRIHPEYNKHCNEEA